MHAAAISLPMKAVGQPRVRYEPGAWDEGKVAIANDHEVPARFTDAREPIPVRARIAWATGDELIETYAVAWTSQLVLVRLSDPRYQLRGVWLAPADVERV